jgi:outer membrane cobalamin receptor
MKGTSTFCAAIKKQFQALLRTAILLGLALILAANPSFAWGKKHREKKALQQKLAPLTGFIVDDEFNEPLEKAVVTIPGTLISVLTDQQGNFKIMLVAGSYSIKVNYPGYFEKYYNVSVSQGIHTPMYIIKLKANATGRELHRKLSSYENKREFPQSMENFNPWQVSEQTGHQEFNEIFKSIPSINFQNNGSGFNDSEIAFRGNDASRTNYSFNGILLNNPETGKVSSSLLSGLTDWAGQIQAVSGQASNLQSQTSYSGLINVLPIAPQEKAGAEVSGIYGNNGFLKTTATVHSGLSKYGWASTFQLSRTAGDGVAENTGFEQYGLLVNVHKEINQFHSFLFNINAIIEQHDRNYSDSIGAYNQYGTRYNSQWGYLNEKPFSASTSYSRSPMVSLTHFWHHRLKTHITTQLFAQFNRSAQAYLQSKLINQTTDSLPRDPNGHLLFDPISSWNKGLPVAGMGVFRLPNTDGNFINSESEGITLMSGINRNVRVGLRSIVTRNISKKLDFSAGFNFEDYRATHNGSVANLLGANGYTSFADLNQPDGFGVSTLFNPKFYTDFKSPDRADYYYKSEVQTGGISARLNYQTNRIFWYIAGSASLQNFIRTDYFNYLNADANQQAKIEIQPGGNMQTGLNFKFWKYHSVHLNASYGSYQPLFSSLFPTNDNWENPGIKNEQNLAAEFGYTIFSRKLKVEATVYWSQLKDRNLAFYSNLKEGDAFGLVNGVDELHKGVELKTSYKLTKNFQFYINGSLGDWTYQNNVNAAIYKADKELSAKNELALKSLKIANAPQFTLFAEAEYRWAHNFYIRLNYYRADQIYMPVGLYDFKGLANPADYKQAELPKYDLIGASANYLFRFRKLPAMNLIFGVQNILDTEYIEYSSTNFPEGDKRYTANQVYYGMGRTWFAGVKIQF